MVFRKTFRYRVYLTQSQIIRLAAWEDALRFLWNLANEQRLYGLSRPRDERVFPTAFNQINEVTDLRAESAWLADVPRDISSCLLIELDKAWQRFFKKIACAPRWKRKGRDAVSFCAPPKKWRLDGDSLQFPKLGAIHIVVHRPFEGRPKACTLKRDGDQWFVSILCEIEIAESTPRTIPVVAIDRGIANFGATSDGGFIDNPKFLEASLKKLAQAQRSLSRKKKGSNREKAKIRVMRIHRKVRRQRAHFLHVQSARFAKSHGIVVLEKLNVAGMIRRRNVSRSIADAGWSRFAEFLRYKMLWNGGSVVEVPAAYSSQTCSACEHVDAASRRSQAVFVCTSCGHVEHADLNAAKVLLTRANRSGKPAEGILPEGTRRSRKWVARISRRAPEDYV